MQSSVKRIEEARTSRLFMENSPKRRLLLSFVRRSRTVSDVAAREGIPIGSAHYLIQDFVRRGLLRVERHEKRGGRAIKHYRAVASSYFVPLEFVAGSPGAGLANELRARLDDELRRVEDDGILFSIDEKGEPKVSWFGDHGRRGGVAEFWQILRLTREDAMELISEMESLFERFQGRAGQGKAFLIHGAVVPRQSSGDRAVND